MLCLSLPNASRLCIILALRRSTGRSVRQSWFTHVNALSTGAPSSTFEAWFSKKHPTIARSSALAVIRLAKDGATLPFIARYRKEQTGNLDEVGIQTVLDAHEEFEAIVKQQSKMLAEIHAQGKLTDALRDRILATDSLQALEDLYLPYKPRRKSKASLAREAGLEPLADWIWNCGHGTEQPQPGQTLELWAFTFRNEAKAIHDTAAAIAGAQDILVERLSESADLRQTVRTIVFERGHLRSQKTDKAKENSKYTKYFDYREPIRTLLQPQNSHRYLAMRRGWMEEELKLSFSGAPDDPDSIDFLVPMESAFRLAACTVPDSPGAAVLQKAAEVALKVHVLPAIEREAHRALKEAADTVAIRVFSENVRKLLLASPFGPKPVVGIDPGIRTGCKVAVVDETGKYVSSHVFHLQTDEQKAAAKAVLGELLKTGACSAVAIGNGTASRETERFVRELVKELGLSIPVALVSEAGASVYSASEVAREEFPDLDVTVRGAISIARRFQDPLAELVKVDPKSIGVGQYQHDVSPHALKKSLDIVVDLCVNAVGVNVNTASYHLLAHVAGIGDATAKNVVAHRATKGLFKKRDELLAVPGFNAKTFEQAAGFLRIPESENPLDNTGVHPERYAAIERAATRLGKTISEVLGDGSRALREDKALYEELGPFTFQDVLRELEKPGRDIREAFVPFHYREDVTKLEDLTPGMLLPGIVTNVTNFGAFVDVGVQQDGLVHLSQLCDRFVSDPHEIVSPGDRVNVRVLSVDLEKRQIAFTMKTPREAHRPEQRREHGESGKEVRAPRRGGERPTGQRGPQPSGLGDRRAPAEGNRRPPRARPLELKHNPFGALAALKGSLPKGPGKS
jgi:uncharacterized protein